MNKQLRKYFPKGKSVNSFEQKDVTNIQNLLNECHLKSLDGLTPKEAFIKLFGEETYKNLIG
jgi:IS30 family transposase